MGTTPKLLDKEFGLLKVIEKSDQRKWGQVLWHCKCRCGNKCLATSRCLTAGITTHCSCRTPIVEVECQTWRKKDVTGVKSGMLTAMKFLYRNKHRQSVWLFQCDCGNKIENVYNNVTNGHTTSCGCNVPCGMAHRWYNPLLTDEDRLRHRNQSKQWRRKIIERDKSCVCCNSGLKLQAHHLSGWAEYKDLRCDLNNGITLCRKCHNLYHSTYGTHNVRPEQFYFFYKERAWDIIA